MDSDSDHHDPRASRENPIWYMVDVRYLAELPEPLTRERLRSHPVHSGMDVLKKGNRLSVQPVTRSSGRRSWTSTKWMIRLNK